MKGRLAIVLMACSAGAGSASAAIPPIPPTVAQRASTAGLVSTGRLATSLRAASVFYSTGTTTASANAYVATAGPQTAIAPAKGQLLLVVFPSANTGAATLNFNAYGAKSIKVLNSAGTVLAMTGGEIVPGPGLLYYDGTQYIYISQPAGRAVATAAAVTLTQANFALADDFYSTAAFTATLPASATLGPNGRATLSPIVGAITLTATGSDTITRSGAVSAAAGSVTLTQGAGDEQVRTDGAGHFYVSP